MVVFRPGIELSTWNEPAEPSGGQLETSYKSKKKKKTVQLAGRVLMPRVLVLNLQRLGAVSARDALRLVARRAGG